MLQVGSDAACWEGNRLGVRSGKGNIESKKKSYVHLIVT